jgi:hypothetical protein
MLNDKDMDVLIGRYAKGAAQGTPVEHPDADELNAFAEGALPPSARQRYLSHFADCDDCRKLVSQLAVTTGAGVEVRIPASEPVAESWWKKFSAVFAIPTLRYAAFAVVLLAVGGIAFLAWRPPAQRNTEMVAQNQPQTNPVQAVKPALTQQPGVTSNDENTQRNANTAVQQPTVSSTSETSDQSKSGLTTLSPPPPPKPADALAAKESAPVVASAGRSDDAPRAQSTPSYAPAPTETYRMDSRERAQQSPGANPGGPRRNESYDKSKVLDRAGDFAKARDEDSNRAAANQPATENKQDSKSAPPSSEVATASRGGVGELRSEARKSAAPRNTTEEAPETRSVGGRKFKRQGNAWIDSKLKSSMSVRTVGRGSEEFEKLDSGLRSIAKQLSGEIVVVWKGKAYRIR